MVPTCTMRSTANFLCRETYRHSINLSQPLKSKCSAARSILDDGFARQLRFDNRRISLEEVCELAGQFDFFLVIDGSTSIGDNNFTRLRNWLVDTVDHLPTNSKYAVVTFSHTASKQWDLTACDTPQNLEENDYHECFRMLLEDLPYIKGTTNIGGALTFATQEVLDEGNRPDYQDIIVLITDGVSADDPAPPAAVLRDKGVRIIVLGIGQVDDEQLRELVVNDNDYLRLSDFNALTAVTRNRLLMTAGSVCTTNTVVEESSDGVEPALNVICGSDSIGVEVGTINPFEGRVYVKHRAEQDECANSGTGADSAASILLKHDQCGTHRRRSVDPPGVFMENTVVVQFHNQVLTKVDRAFTIQCFYMEADKTVDDDLAVSMLNTEEVTAVLPMPVCTYSLHSGAPDGPDVRYAMVGDPIWHRWHCDDSAAPGAYKMKVVDCVVTDALGESGQTLLDPRGCLLDRHLLGAVDYVQDQLLAVAETHAFKYPDGSLARFNCRIQLCSAVAGDDGCANFPPNCAGGALRSARHKRSSGWLFFERNGRNVTAENELHVFDRADFGFFGDIGFVQESTDRGATRRQNLCVPFDTLVGAGSLAMLLLFAITTAVVLIIRRR